MPGVDPELWDWLRVDLDSVYEMGRRLHSRGQDLAAAKRDADMFLAKIQDPAGRVPAEISLASAWHFFDPSRNRHQLSPPPPRIPCPLAPPVRVHHFALLHPPPAHLEMEATPPVPRCSRAGGA
eukprot:13677495-Alexandrium_andersonii.AAC.1